MGSVEGRLRWRLDHLKLSGRRLAEMTGESQSNVARWLKEGGAPASFLLACEEVGIARASWLLTGEGSPDVSETEAQDLLERVRALLGITRPASSPGDLLDDVASVDDAERGDVDRQG